MKTQLLQDIGDSGAAAPAGPAAHKVRPAVWHRAQAAPDATAQLPEPEGRIEPSVDPADDVATAPEPDWLAELMRQDAARADAQQKAGRWRRRVFGWSIGAGLLALVAAGALWMTEARRVDGAMAVVAAGVPAADVPAGGAPDAGTSTSGTPAAGSPALVPAPVPAPKPTLAPVLSSPRPAPTILEEVVKPAAPVSTEPAMPGIRREHAVSKAASRAPVERVQSDRRRREETLLQCRALGYDEGQCIRRECEMTRFGLACRGGVMGADVPP
ncbi:hypothetical protein [Herbaspirillum sp. SJZ107]|uniref:hypothetical protein n=1 Tax=Herbaspirillum sp. SJZ107 TaxID=2572881 RepID=UPI001152FBD9|nr:hypothetical protein [Herbaspirillum sp. SJZ107]TQK11657.1 hypothetical protein FBX97_1606 [Herbaspirillum sp. SJZ107]